MTGPVSASVSFLVTLVWVVIAFLALLAGLRLRARLRQLLGRATFLDRAAVRQIEVSGRVGVDDELDLAAIEDEERRFSPGAGGNRFSRGRTDRTRTGEESDGLWSGCRL